VIERGTRHTHAMFRSTDKTSGGSCAGVGQQVPTRQSGRTALLDNIQQPKTCQRGHATGIDAFAARLGTGERRAIEHHDV
jgi:hypothetical protein